jgi:outer membrane murein-binding lipoprotein Lpp
MRAGTPLAGTPRPAALGRRATGLALAIVAFGGLGLTGCSVVAKVKAVAHAVEGNKNTIDAFNSKLGANQPPEFEATYVTTGSSPATIVYAVDSPTGLAFTDTPSGTGSTTLDIIVNSSGEYSCMPSSRGSGPSCQRVKPADKATENEIFSFYTPTHWVTFLRDFSIAAGFAGDKVTPSSMTVNGFAMSCVDFVASGVPGTSTICSTSAGILGYVKVASDATSFEITSYSTSPPASLFKLPAGATVTTVSTPPTTS